MDMVVTEANSRMYKLRDALEKYQDNDLKFKLQNVLVEVESDKKMAKDEFLGMRNT